MSSPWTASAAPPSPDPTPPPISESELVQRFLASPVARSALHAAEAQVSADGTGPAPLPNPTLDARRDQANGPAGARTTAVGGSLELDLGFAAVSHSRAARLREQAGTRRGRAWALAAVCDLQHDAVDLWRLDARSEVFASTQDHLDHLATTLAERAASGDVAGYDRDRAVAAAATHRSQAVGASADVAAARASLGAWVGGRVHGVRLSDAWTDDLDALLVAVSAHPELDATRHLLAAAERDQSAARQLIAPSLTVHAGARWDAMPDGSASALGYEVGGSLELPVFDVKRREVRQAAATAAVVQARLETATRDRLASVHAAWDRLAALGHPADPSVPHALWEAASQRYLAGEASIDELVSVATAARDAALAAIDHTHAVHRARRALACASGVFPDPDITAALTEVP